MTDSLNISLAQQNPVLGDIEGNIAKIRKGRAEAKAQGADLVIYSELNVCGYPPEDLVLKPAFQQACESAVTKLAAETADGGPALLVGSPWREDGKLYNAAVLLDQGRVATARYKCDLPNYGVFDEKRVFTPSPPQGPVNFRNVRLGVMVCEDMWNSTVTECLAETGAEILMLGNGSPYEHEKQEERIQLAVQRVKESSLPIIYVNQVGGQDELVFDGASFVVDGDYSLKAQLPAFMDKVSLTRWQRQGDHWRCVAGELTKPLDGLPSIYAAMTLGLRDYVEKNRFPGVLLGLSGGIDSAITAAVAVDALGPDRVWAVMMPSPYTSQESLDDAAEVARLLGIRLDTVSIEPAMKAFADMLKTQFAGTNDGIAEQNIQSRARGLTLMALSNKFGHMVLSTGNKSEMSVGYATLYGDMCGGYSVLKDVYKTTVFALSRWRNENRLPDARGPAGRVMPDNVITRPPTAELKADQKDEDDLPRYATLDKILECLIENEMGVDEIVARGHDRATVERIWRMLDRAEYKRRQAPPGVKITRRAFGRDRRYPITNAYRGRLMTARVRIAPSPTGRLHVGNIYIALANWLFARRAGGVFLLRMDDTDRERSTEESAASIEEDLRWLGLDWQEFARQSDRIALYDAAAGKLKASKRLYPCYETPEELDLKRRSQQQRHLPPVYDRAALNLTAEDRARLEAQGLRPHWRFLLNAAHERWDDLVRGAQDIDEASQSDPVMIRGDGSYLYTFTSVVDDIDLGITHIIRGADHVTNTGAQAQLFEALGAKPPRFGHLPLLANISGEGLSKRTGSLSIAELRADGIEAMAINSYLARVGTTDKIEPVAELDALAATFALNHYNAVTPKFDPQELVHLNARLLHLLPFGKVKAKLSAMGLDAVDEPLWTVARANIGKLADLREWLEVSRGPIAPVIADTGFAAAAAGLLPPEPWGPETWSAWTGAVKSATGRKGKELFQPLRLALTARDHGPEMKEFLPLIGRDRALARLRGERA